MIDTCGLPMKFEFEWYRTRYLVDFYEANENGWPRMVELDNIGNEVEAPFWSSDAERTATLTGNGTWKIVHVYDEVPSPVVEDLL